MGLEGNLVRITCDVIGCEEEYLGVQTNHPTTVLDGWYTVRMVADQDTRMVADQDTAYICPKHVFPFTLKTPTPK